MSILLRNLRDETRPQERTPEQIKECHGDAEKHPCAEKKAEVWSVELGLKNSRIHRPIST